MWAVYNSCFNYNNVCNTEMKLVKVNRVSYRDKYSHHVWSLKKKKKKSFLATAVESWVYVKFRRFPIQVFAVIQWLHYRYAKSYVIVTPCIKFDYKGHNRQINFQEFIWNLHTVRVSNSMEIIKADAQIRDHPWIPSSLKGEVSTITEWIVCYKVKEKWEHG